MNSDQKLSAIWDALHGDQSPEGKLNAIETVLLNDAEARSKKLLAEIDKVFGQAHPDGHILRRMVVKLDKYEISALFDLLQGEILCEDCCGNGFDQDTDEDCLTCNATGRLSIQDARDKNSK